MSDEFWKGLFIAVPAVVTSVTAFLAARPRAEKNDKKNKKRKKTPTKRRKALGRIEDPAGSSDRTTDRDG